MALAVGLLSWLESRASVRLVGVTPAGAVVPPGPTEVVLTFDGPPKVAQMHVTVQGPGVPSTLPSPTLRGERVVLPVTLGAEGVYHLGYHVELVDGRQYSGIEDFTVSRTAAPAAPAPAEPPPAAAHAHDNRDPSSAVLLGIDAVLIGAVLMLLVGGPRRSWPVGERGEQRR
ncbi:copper resistance protein CopC [Dactylosporangium sp. NPDC000555]|uniref:copper resistance protein CopC n=1 Tax=Dactylosporangium sp. NPDC000555 TaxID=3154260 RepID=UPI00332FAABC